MECPFKIPVKTEKKRPLYNPFIVDKNGDEICMCQNIDEADYIVQAINSHEKLKTALEVISDHEDCRKKADIGYDGTVDEYAKQALEAEK